MRSGPATRNEARIAVTRLESASNEVTRLAEMHAVPVLEQHTKNELGDSLDHTPKAVLAVLNRHFSSGIIEKSSLKAPLKTADLNRTRQ